jgi:AcrR family transcriptional regulator
VRRNSAKRNDQSGLGDGTEARRPSKADISRERVLAAAARIFSERGYAGATMRDIAREANLLAGSLYYHYPSKELLIEAVLDRGIHGVSTAVYNAIAELPPSSSYADRLQAAIDAHLQSILTYGAYAAASRHLLAQVPIEIRRKHVLRRDAYGDFWLRLLESAQAAGEVRQDIDLRLMRTFILGALNSTVDWYRPDGKPVSEIAAQFAAIIADGALTDHPTRSGPAANTRSDG